MNEKLAADIQNRKGEDPFCLGEELRFGLWERKIICLIFFEKNAREKNVI